MAPFIAGNAAAGATVGETWQASMQGHEHEQIALPQVHVNNADYVANMQAELLLYRQRNKAAAVASALKPPSTRPDPFITPASASPMLIRA